MCENIPEQQLPEKSFCFIEDLVDQQINKAIEESIQHLCLLESEKQRDGKSLFVNFKTILFKKLNSRYELSMSNIFVFVLFFWTLFYTFRHSKFFAISFPDREAPLPSPFFKNSKGLIQDYYDGNISEFEALRFNAEFTIVMLYSPWDFRSKLFRSSFLYVAKLFKDVNSIKFIAVNCNYYKGRCRLMYKLLAFPVIFAQTQYKQPIIFNQFLSSERLYSWIINLLFPLNILNSEEDLNKLILNSEFVIIGHFEFFSISSPLPRSYSVFVNSAYYLNNRRSSLAFGLILNKTISSNLNIYLNQLNIYSLYSNNLLKIGSFEINSTQKTQNVVEWINKCLDEFNGKIVKEIEIEDGESPSKSDALFKKLNSSNFNLVLFTNLIGLRQQSFSLIAVRNVAKLINYCPSDSNELESNKLIQFSSKNNLNNFLQKYINLCSIKEHQIIFCCQNHINICLNYSFKKFIEEIYGRINCSKIFKIYPKYLLKLYCQTSKNV
ncbi:hypothetical protein ACQ4LE_003615, partial [Meloidogyne hapla]